MKRLTEKRILNIALFYLSRYESSASKVRAMLHRRLRKMQLRGEEIPSEAPQWIDNAITTAEKNAYLNDERYAATQVRHWIEQGKSERYMMAKLEQAGIDPNISHRLLTESDSTDQERARRFLKRKHLGPYRPTADQALYRTKDLAALARAGFSYDVAQSALQADTEI